MWPTCRLSFNTIGGSIHQRICLQTTISRWGDGFTSFLHLAPDIIVMIVMTGIGRRTLHGGREPSQLIGFYLTVCKYRYVSDRQCDT